MSTWALPFLTEKSNTRLIKKMKISVSSGGIVSISAFTEADPQKGFPYSFKKNELRDYFKDWAVLCIIKSNFAIF
jgi:hypothetical protein